MADWEDEDFEPPAIDKPGLHVTDQWEGEDEEDTVKDNWDDEDVEEEKPPTEAPTPAEPKKKKALAKKLKEKEEKAAKALEEKRKAELNKTPEQILEEKLLAQKLAEESDLEVTKDTFGMNVTDPNKMTIDNFDGSTKEDFTNFESMLSEKICKFESSPHYYFLLETLFRNCCLSLDAESIKKLVSSLSVLQNEKAKQERQKKGGKKGGKAKLAGSTKARDDIIDYSAYDDMDDFM